MRFGIYTPQVVAPQTAGTATLAPDTMHALESRAPVARQRMPQANVPVVQSTMLAPGAYHNQQVQYRAAGPPPMQNWGFSNGGRPTERKADQAVLLDKPKAVSVATTHPRVSEQSSFFSFCFLFLLFFLFFLFFFLPEILRASRLFSILVFGWLRERHCIVKGDIFNRADTIACRGSQIERELVAASRNQWRKIKGIVINDRNETGGAQPSGSCGMGWTLDRRSVFVSISFAMNHLHYLNLGT